MALVIESEHLRFRLFSLGASRIYVASFLYSAFCVPAVYYCNVQHHRTPGAFGQGDLSTDATSFRSVMIFYCTFWG